MLEAELLAVELLKTKVEDEASVEIVSMLDETSTEELAEDLMGELSEVDTYWEVRK